MKIPARIFKQLTRQLRDIRRCPIQVRMNYQDQFVGYIFALLDMGVILDGQYSRLRYMSTELFLKLDGRRVLKSPEVQSSLPVVEVDHLPDWDSSAENCEVENVGDQVSKDSASSRLPVRRLLVKKIYHSFARDFRSDLPRLGDWWAPAFVLENYSAKKRHSVCRV